MWEAPSPLSPGVTLHSLLGGPSRQASAPSFRRPLPQVRGMLSPAAPMLLPRCRGTSEQSPLNPPPCSGCWGLTIAHSHDHVAHEADAWTCDELALAAVLDATAAVALQAQSCAGERQEG